MYAIIRYPANEKPGTPEPILPVNDFLRMDKEQKEAFCKSTATIYERETFAEIKDCLEETARNPYCISAEWRQGRRSLVATRADGRQFIFAIVKK